MFAKVIVDISNNELDRVFDYDVGDLCVEPGCRVSVPFGNRVIEGYVIKLTESSELSLDKVKNIIGVMDAYPVITPEMMKLMEYMRKRYNLRIIDVLRLFIPSQMRGGKVKELVQKIVCIDDKTPVVIKENDVMQKQAYEYVKERGTVPYSELSSRCSAAAVRNLVQRGIFKVTEVGVNRVPYKDVKRENKFVTLTPAQQSAVDEISSGSKQTFLLHGVTGSGKTEVYMRCISDQLDRGKTAIMLVPEISLTPQVFALFRARFGEKVAILHSGLSVGERFDEWRRLISGEAVVAVGARSAVFAPLSDLGIIIIDEEHDSSYTSESNPRYFTSEVARFRRDYNGCNIVMGSATPSIESYYKAKIGEYKLIELPERVNHKPMPHISIVDMRKEVLAGNNDVFSRELTDKLASCISEGNQAIIFINRRGYSSYLMCRSCGYVAKCDRCDVSLVYHKEDDVLKCHYCGSMYKPFSICPKCGSAHVKRGFVGTEQVVERIKQLFNVNVVRMDNDTTQGKDAHLKILEEFASGSAQVLVGTQMIAKGHDFPNVTLVGIVDADMSLHFSDYRASERTYQLITQVAGRAGRDKKTGSVILQTYSPSHYVYKFAISNDYKGFYEKECNLRELTLFPPFTYIVRVLVSGEDESLVGNALKSMYDEIKNLAQDNLKDFAFLNYMWSPVRRIKGMVRAQILLRLKKNYDNYITEIYRIADNNKSNKINVFVETNPNNLS